MENQHEDVQAALTQAEAGPESGESSSQMSAHGGAAVMATSKNPFSQLWWGMSQAWQKTVAEAKRHPWWAALGLGGAMAAGQFLCTSCGIMILAGMMIWAIRKS